MTPVQGTRIGISCVPKIILLRILESHLIPFSPLNPIQFLPSRNSHDQYFTSYTTFVVTFYIFIPDNSYYKEVMYSDLKRYGNFLWKDMEFRYGSIPSHTRQNN